MKPSVPRFTFAHAFAIAAVWGSLAVIVIAGLRSPLARDIWNFVRDDLMLYLLLGGGGILSSAGWATRLITHTAYAAPAPDTEDEDE